MSNMLFNKNELKILGEFGSSYHGRIYGREIAKNLGMNQKTVSNVLNILERENVLKSVYEGRNKYCYLNSNNLHIKEILKLVEISRKVGFLERNGRKRALFDEVEKRASGILVVFGSYARGEETRNSDLDIFLIGKIGELTDLEELWRIKINTVKSTKGKFDKGNNFIKEIIKNHIVLKGVEDFVEMLW